MFNIWKWLGDNKDQVQIILLIGAAMLTFTEYRSSLKSEKIERTLELVTRYSENQIYRARIDLLVHWQQKQNIEELKAHVKNGDFNEFIVSLVEKKMWHEKILILQSFYHNIIVCVDGEICNAEKACEYFGGDVRSFANTYYGYLVLWGGRWNEDFYSPLDEFVDDCISKNSLPR